MFETVVRFFQDGGVFMYPIAIVLVIGVAIAVERYIYLSVAKLSNRADFNKLIMMIGRKDYLNALKQAKQSKTAMSTIVEAGLTRLLNRQPRDQIEYAMEEGLMEVLPRLEKRTQYLATLANVSTLLGLLGTIIGLIAAFTAVANADPAEKANLLSKSISVAMNTTAFGLIAAIPLLLVHAILQTKTNEIVDSFEMAGIKIMNLISEKPAQAAPVAKAAPERT
ncbi:MULTISPECIES: MotA/TolQ/ExbB proton channel family protein [unclassified Hahella]|uniref:MotA/TolQ/ExbB proton channel family protein n=1 Tax=unclassified Hahella TaxID=2624107 RepID=UPI000FDF20C9|nr:MULTISPECIES: MotA/TolQ/ExbB proton channel family protein [unclassified Hahella]AZZ93073.1 MotA/TolQ/ExbB proton channel family protein [Hahella sp. KA22]MBU6950522.1 MotA/TolQ/ExbB proton channel family protein [Hahella sp. HN01]MDG9667937.1 MotA/TolQ/ExbB proton channel family protein [Hahella sp. CR1]QAY56447.1 MotA/TolQ/ExbB proton channel family protein [Hahella sp. KA22]